MPGGMETQPLVCRDQVSTHTARPATSCTAFTAFWILLQIEQEGVSVKGSPHFNPDPDAETLYKAMKGIGEWLCHGIAVTLWGCACPAHSPG